MLRNRRFILGIILMCVLGFPHIGFAKSNSDHKLKPWVTSYLIGSDQSESDISIANPVTVIASRLPSFRTRLSDIPGNVSFIPANVSYKSSDDLFQSSPKIFQDS